MKSALWAVLLVAVACGKRDQPEQKREDPPRRVIEPLAKGLRALPPHAIRNDGVGPYKLGETVAQLLAQLPSGPRITQFTIPGLVQRDILRAEDDAILIGAQPQGKAMFVAVVYTEIARTEGGIHVGSTRDELVRVLGAPIDDPDRAQDPHIIISRGLPNLHSLVEGDRIKAMVVAADDPGKDLVGETACTRPRRELDKPQFGACLTGSGEVVRYEEDGKLEVFAKDGEKQVAQPLAIPGLVFAAALRNPSDGRDDIIAITRTVNPQAKSWSLVVFRPNDKGVLVRIMSEQVFQLTAANARWIGADLRDVDVYAEVTGRGDVIEVGGLLTTRVGDKIRDIVVISPVPVTRRRAKTVPHEDAGTSDIGERAPR